MYSLAESVQLAVIQEHLERYLPGEADPVRIRLAFLRLFRLSVREERSLLTGQAGELAGLVTSDPGEMELLVRLLGDPVFLRQTREEADRELILCGEYNIRAAGYSDPGYPSRLRLLSSPPPVVFWQGELPDKTRMARSLALVGSRTPDEVFAPATALWAAGELAGRGWINISGLSPGCDTYGHVSSLQSGGLTGAVVGFGLSQVVYPPENILLAEVILERGGFLLSESVPSAPVSVTRLILRDRLQSILTRGIFVLETDLGSGTIFTVDFALWQNRTVFVWDPSGSGLEDDPRLSGNQVLLGRRPCPDWLSLPEGTPGEQIVPVLEGDELTRWLDGMDGISTQLEC